MDKKIGYYYNWKDLVVITRDDEGEWRHTYNPSKVVEYVNRKIKKQHFNSQDKVDVFNAGLRFGYKLNTLLEKCQKSYGDTPFEVKID